MKVKLLMLFLSFVMCLGSIAEDILIPVTDSKVTYTLSCFGIPFKKKPLPTILKTNIIKTEDGKFLINSLETETYFTSKNKFFRTFIDYDKYPGFSFKSISEEPIEVINNKECKINGELTFHGITRSIYILFTPTIINEKIFITGNYDIEMTDFGLEPPIFLFAKVDNAISTKFELVESLPE